MTTREKISELAAKMNEAYLDYVCYIKDKVAENHGCKLDGWDGKNDKGVRIHVSDEDHNNQYYPSFDAVDVRECPGISSPYFIFHVVKGDDFANDGDWVSETSFGADEWEELLDFIQWPDDEDND